MYIDSNKIKVFPSSMRGTDGNQYNPEARLTTEHNLTSMVNAGGKYGSFVISKDFSYTPGDTNTQSFVFCIDGYIFEIANAVTTLNLNTMSITEKLYVDIKVLDKDVALNSSHYNLPTLTPYDESSVILDREGKFYGLSISKTRTDNSFEILECINDVNHPLVRVPKSSKFIAIGDDIDMSNVENDCTFKTIKSSNILPSDSSSTIGTSSNPFDHGYFKALNPKTIKVSSSLEAPVITIRDSTGAITTELNKNGASIKNATIGSLKATTIEAIANDNLTVNAHTINTNDLNVDADADITGTCKAGRVALPIDQTEKVVLSSYQDKLNIDRVGSSETTRSWGFLYPESAGYYKLGYKIYNIDMSFALRRTWTDENNLNHTENHDIHNYIQLITDKYISSSTSSSQIETYVKEVYGNHIGGQRVVANYYFVNGNKVTYPTCCYISDINLSTKRVTCAVLPIASTAGDRYIPLDANPVNNTITYKLLS